MFVPASSGLPGFLRWFAAYWFTMLAAGVFIYCGVLGVQGLAAQVLPRRLFLRVSGFLQLAAFCLFVCGYFLQPVFGGLASLTAPEIRRLLRWMPSYWFLGLFHQLNGSMHPALAPLARRAWIGARDCGVRHGGGVRALLFADAAQDRGGAGYHARLAAVRLAAAFREQGADRDRAIQRAHAGAQPAASDDSGVLSRNRFRVHHLSAESSGDAERGSPMRRRGHAAAGGEHRDDGAGGGGNARGVRAAAGSAGQLDLPRHAAWRRRGNA